MFAISDENFLRIAKEVLFALINFCWGDCYLFIICHLFVVKWLFFGKLQSLRVSDWENNNQYIKSLTSGKEILMKYFGESFSTLAFCNLG